MSNAGRKTLCTPEIIREISTNLIAGLSNRDAAALSGITEATFYGWYARGRDETERLKDCPRCKPKKNEKIFVEFFEAIEKAIPKRKQTLIGNIQKAALGKGEITETKRVYKDGILVEEVTTVKGLRPEWTASAWLAERLHPDEFGRRQRVDVYDWRDRIKTLLDSGAISEEDLIKELGPELATEFIDTGTISDDEIGEDSGSESGELSRSSSEEI